MKRSTLQRGRIIGTPGGSLNETATWAKNQHVVKAGHDAEVKTGEKLNQWALCEGGPTVLHDLHIPGSNANIDHVVVSGTKVLMVDSKAWKPATYWTIFGHTYRGSQRRCGTHRVPQRAACPHVPLQRAHHAASHRRMVIKR